MGVRDGGKGAAVVQLVRYVTNKQTHIFNRASVRASAFERRLLQ